MHTMHCNSAIHCRQTKQTSTKTVQRIRRKKKHELRKETKAIKIMKTTTAASPIEAFWWIHWIGAMTAILNYKPYFFFDRIDKSISISVHFWFEWFESLFLVGIWNCSQLRPFQSILIYFWFVLLLPSNSVQTKCIKAAGPSVCTSSHPTFGEEPSKWPFRIFS